MKTAAAYARYSTDKQTENSIAYQVTKISQYCAEQEIQIVATYTDEAQSGTNTDRAGFQRLIAAAGRHEFDVVVIYDISRGSRDVGDWFSFRKHMLLLGIEVISATGQRIGDVTNGTDFMMELLTVGMGQMEVLNTRQKSIDGVAIQAKQGKFLGGTPPLGYDVLNGQYVINETEAKTVRLIFDLYATGHSYGEIIGALDGQMGKRGRPMGVNSLHNILKNERYIGVYTWNKRQMRLMRKWAGGKPNPNCVRLEGMIPRIINDSTWKAVQKRMENNKRNACNKAKRQYLLSGLIECECCGSTYVGHTSTNSRGYSTSYYVCGNKYRTHTCHAQNINAEEIETFVVQQLKAYLLSVDFEETAQTIANTVNGASVDLHKEKAELAAIEKKISNGVQAVLSGLQVPELQEEIDRLRIRRSELQDIIARRSSERAEIDPADIVRLLQDSVDHWDDAHLPQIIRQHITKIYAHVDGSCTVNVGVHINGCGGAVDTLPEILFGAVID